MPDELMHGLGWFRRQRRCPVAGCLLTWHLGRHRNAAGWFDTPKEGTP